jgi:RimJ/RimL family protein N-acetyltransferase
MTQKGLQTKRLQLVPLTAEHESHVVALNSDATVMKYLEGRGHTTEEAGLDHAQRLASGKKIAGLGHWAGFKDGNFVGWWALAPTENHNGAFDLSTAELGYRLLPTYWRQGLAKEGSIELLRHGFEELGLESVFGQTMAVNVPSRATMESCGLRHVRTFMLNFDDPLPGTELGEVEYRITSVEWDRMQMNLHVKN